MGLDMYAFKTREVDLAVVDATLGDDAELIFQWRKHPNLHGWMEALYRLKCGTRPEFNCATVRLDSDDLNRLEQAILEGRLPNTQGFFFGASDGTEHADDLAFIALARDAITDGYWVYYDSWW